MGRLAAGRRARRRAGTTSRCSRPATRTRRPSSPPIHPVAPSEWIGRSFWELRHILHCYERADDFDVINDHSGPFAAALGAAIDTPVVHTVHGPLDGEPGELYDQVSRVAPRDRVHLALDEPAQAAAELQLARELPERARPLGLPVPSAARRLPALPRADEPGQGRASRGGRGDGGRAAAEDRGQEARAEGAAVLRRVR